MRKVRSIWRRSWGAILKEPVIHVDETGVKISGTQNWMHTITNEKGSYYVCTEKRGRS